MTTIFILSHYDKLCIPCLADLFLFLIYANTFEIVHTYVCVQSTNAHEMLSDSLKYLTFGRHIFFLHTYNLSNILQLSVIFVLLDL